MPMAVCNCLRFGTSEVWATGYKDDSSWLDIAEAKDRNRASALVMSVGDDARVIVKGLIGGRPSLPGADDVKQPGHRGHTAFLEKRAVAHQSPEDRLSGYVHEAAGPQPPPHACPKNALGQQPPRPPGCEQNRVGRGKLCRDIRPVAPSPTTRTTPAGICRG